VARRPVLVCLSIRSNNLKDTTVSYDENIKLSGSQPWGLGRPSAPLGLERLLMTMPPAILRSFDESTEMLMKPSFDMLARAAGLPGSPRYRK